MFPLNMYEKLNIELSANITTSLADPLVSGSEDRDGVPQQWSLVLGMVVTMTVMVAGSCGNMVTLATLVHQFYMPRRDRYVKDVTADTVLIINLAIADLFYSSISLPFMFVTYYRLSRYPGPPWEEDSMACTISAFLRYTNAIAEWTTLGLMALERSIAIYKFRNNRRPGRGFTPKKTFLYCCLIWFICMTCQLPTLFEVFGCFGYNMDYAKCDFLPQKNESTSLFSPRTVFFALESIVPFFLILIGYVVLLVQIYSHSTSVISINQCSSTQRLVALRRSRTTRVIIKLLLVYLVCVLPCCAYNIFVWDSNNAREKQELGIVLYCIYWPQYCINNFIYVVSNGKYRCAYVQFLFFVTCREVPKPSTPGAVCEKRSKSNICVISGSAHHLQEPQEVRIRTLSEYEEDRRTQNKADYTLHRDNSDNSLARLGRSHSVSISSTSSQQQLIKSQQWNNHCHLTHSGTQNLKGKCKLKRTFSY